MGQYSKLAWIAGAILFIIAISVVLFGAIGLMGNIETSIDDSQSENFRKAIVAENMLSLKASPDELSATSSEYEYQRQKAVLPVEYFTNMDPEGDEIGFNVNNGHCYIEGVSGLNGVDFGFYLRPLADLDSYGATNPRDIPCISESGVTGAFSVPAILVRDAEDNPRLPVRIYVYKAGEESGPISGSVERAATSSRAELEQGSPTQVSDLDGGFTYIGRSENAVAQKAHIRYDSSTATDDVSGCGGRVISGIPVNEVTGGSNECAHSGIISTPEGEKKVAICSADSSNSVQIGVGSVGTSASQLCSDGGGGIS